MIAAREISAVEVMDAHLARIEEVNPAVNAIVTLLPDAALMLSAIAGPDPRAPISLSEPGTVFRPPLDGDGAGKAVAWSRDLGGPIVTVAMLSLALNLALTGVFILIVRKLIDGVPEAPQPAPSTVGIWNDPRTILQHK